MSVALSWFWIGSGVAGVLGLARLLARHGAGEDDEA